MKSNSNVSIISELAKLGSGADVVSEGELLKALKAKVKPSKIVFSGVGKTENELRTAIRKKVFLINIESESDPGGGGAFGSLRVPSGCESIFAVGALRLRFGPSMSARSGPFRVVQELPMPQICAPGPFRVP